MGRRDDEYRRRPGGRKGNAWVVWLALGVVVAVPLLFVLLVFAGASAWFVANALK